MPSAARGVDEQKIIRDDTCGVHPRIGWHLVSGIRFRGIATLPSPQMIDTFSSRKDDPSAIKELWSDVDMARQENAKLTDLADHSFDVMLGALLGFLSAGVSAGIGRPTGAPPTATDKSPPTSAAQEEPSTKAK
jgi:hypothetical protein